jgi:uncharacterized protein (TIGR02145 family)
MLRYKTNKKWDWNWRTNNNSWYDSNYASGDAMSEREAYLNEVSESSAWTPQNIVLTLITGGIRIAFTPYAGAETEIYVSTNQGAYSLVTTLGVGIGTYDYMYSEGGADFNFKLRSKIDTTVLNAPSNVASVKITGGTRITWVDNNTESDHIEIYANISEAGYTLIATVLAGVQTYDHTIGAGTVVYKVRAKEGTLPVYSNYSNVTDSLSIDITDADGNIYTTITVDSQIWLAQALKTTKYNDGSAIDYPLAAGWAADNNGAYGWRNWDVANKAQGAMYNSYAYNNVKGICPVGFRLPTSAELETLSVALGGDSVSGGSLKISGTTYWASPNTGTHASGFNIMGAGFINEGTGASNNGLYYAMLACSDKMAYMVQNSAVLTFASTPSLKRGLMVLCIKN